MFNFAEVFPFHLVLLAAMAEHGKVEILRLENSRAALDERHILLMIRPTCQIAVIEAADKR